MTTHYYALAEQIEIVGDDLIELAVRINYNIIPVEIFALNGPENLSQSGITLCILSSIQFL